MARPAALISGLIALALLARDAGAAGLLLPRDGGAPIEVESQRIEASVVDGLARTTLRQTFVSPREDAIEADYRFPVPEGAALVGVAVETGGKRFEGLLAVRKTAAAPESAPGGDFCLPVFPVLPGEDTVVELTWVEHLPLTRGLLRYVYPLSLVTDGPSRHRHGLGFRVTLVSSVPFRTEPSEDEFPEGTEVLRKAPGRIVVSHDSTRTRLDRDLVVRALIAQREPTLSVRTYRGAEGDGWFLAVVTPPMVRESELIPRDVHLLIDTSLSMKGSRLEKAKRAARHLLGTLRPGDRANVTRFGSDLVSFAEEPVLANLASVARLAGFVDRLTAVGGRALGDAVRAVAELPPAEGRARIVVLITDGPSTDGERDPRKIVGFARAAGSSGLRIHTFGVGGDVDAGLLRRISRASRGRSYVFVPEDRLEARLRSFLARTARPVIADARLDVEGVEVYDIFPRPIPEASAGEQVVVTGRYREGGDAVVRVFATVGTSTTTLRARARFPRLPGGDPAVAWLAAIRHLRALEGEPPGPGDEVVAERIRVSLSHGVQCPETSFRMILGSDRQRLSPEDSEAVAAAVRRAARARWELAPLVRDPPTNDLEEVEQDATRPARLDGYRPEPEPIADVPPPSPSFLEIRKTRARLRRGIAGARVEDAVDLALLWLVNAQKDDGRWSAGRPDDFHDIGVTGLALLALLGAGEEPVGTTHSDTVLRGLTWLLAQQDGEGCFGMRKSERFVYDHAIATRAAVEACAVFETTFSRSSAQRGLDFIEKCRSPYLAWRYGIRPKDNDTSVSAWMLFALAMGRRAGLRVDEAAFDGMRSWLDKVTEPEFGRAGYTARGGALAREPDLMDRFPSDRSESTTAAAVFCRVLLGENPRTSEPIQKGAALCLKLLPVWDEASGSIDMIYWYFGTLAMAQVRSGASLNAGTDFWRPWWEAVLREILTHQRTAGEKAGSWDPAGAWGGEGGRVFSTALMTMCLEAEHLYPGLSSGRGR